MYSQLRVSKSCSGLFRSCGGHLPLLQRLSQFPQQIASDFARTSLFGPFSKKHPFLILGRNSLYKNSFCFCWDRPFLRGLCSCGGFQNRSKILDTLSGIFFLFVGNLSLGLEPLLFYKIWARWPIMFQVLTWSSDFRFAPVFIYTKRRLKT